MKYRVNEDTEFFFDENHQLEIVKGIWNREEIVIELDENDLFNESMTSFLKKIERKEEIEVKDVVDNSIKELFEYLLENGFLEKAEKSDSIAQILKGKKILLIVSDEFRNMSLNLGDDALEMKNIVEFQEEIGLEDVISLDVMDAYELELMRRKAKESLTDYMEVSFLLKNPDIEQLKVFAKVLNDIEKITSYAIVDNGILFSFTCIPYESPCFNCFDLRISSRSGIYQLNHIHKGKKGICDYGCMSINKSTMELQLAFDWTVKILSDDTSYQTRGNIGNVIIFDLRTLEVTRERLYKVPFCEVC